MIVLISIKEFCRCYGVGRTKAYALIDAGEISAVKVGSSTRIVAASAEKWVCRLTPVRTNERPHDDGDLKKPDLDASSEGECARPNGGRS